VVTVRQIPLARPFLDRREEELVLEVLRSGDLALGPMYRRFEEAFADVAGTRYAVACSSGTAGLHACLQRVGVGPGDEVITSAFSFVASANVILFQHATPVFAEIDERTLNVDPAAIEAAITPRTKAIIPVHIFGYPCEIGAISRIAAAHGLAVVEDACEALGASVDGRPLGTFGNPAVYGFYPNKQITTGEGGMITTDDPDVERELRSIVNQGRSDNGDWLVHQRLGFNFRMDEMSAAVGLAQLEKLEFLLAERARVASRYQQLLAGVDGIELPHAGGHARTWFIYYVRLADGIDRRAVIEGMDARGIATRPYLPAIHLQPEYRRLGMCEGMLPITERVSRSTLALPFFIQLEDQDIEYVCTSLREVIETRA
jgi:perosamine synthetase